MWKKTLTSVAELRDKIRDTVSDKKNLPLVVGAAIGGILVIGGAYYYFSEKKSDPTCPKHILQQIKIHRGGELKSIADSIIREKDGSVYLPADKIAYVQELAVDITAYRIREILKEIRAARRNDPPQNYSNKILGLLETFDSGIRSVLKAVNLDKAQFDLTLKDQLKLNPDLEYSGYKVFRVIHRYLGSANNRVTFTLDLCLTSLDYVSQNQPEPDSSSDKAACEQRWALYDGLHKLTKLEEEDLKKLTELYSHVEEVSEAKTKVKAVYL